MITRTTGTLVKLLVFVLGFWLHAVRTIFLLHVLPFGKDNIKHADWRHRDAALSSFGFILEGPDPAQLKTLVEKAMAMLIELKDTSVVVKDMAAWTIGRVCE